MAAAVGKTYRMLQEGRHAKAEGPQREQPVETTLPVRAGKVAPSRVSPSNDQEGGNRNGRIKRTTDARRSSRAAESSADHRRSPPLASEAELVADHRCVRCGSRAKLTSDDAPRHKGAERCDEERNNRQSCADHANHSQYEPDDPNHPGDEAPDGVPVEPLLPNPPRRVTPTPLKITHTLTVARPLSPW
jgi:hypothetical protein